MSGAGELVAPLVARWGLEPRAGDRLAALLGVLEDDPTAPTSVRGAREAVDVHLADSLVALELEAVRAAGRIADLGSGAGFPGLALAVALPNARVALVESAARKCEFLGRAIAAAGVPNAEAVHARAEAWSADSRVLLIARLKGRLELRVVRDGRTKLVALLLGGEATLQPR